MLSIKAPWQHTQQQPVRIGLLLCGDVHAALQPGFGNYASCLVRQLRLNNPGTEIRVWQAWKGELPKDVRDADAYLVSGSPASAFDRLPWIIHLGDFIRCAYRARKRLLGICFGHQIIHLALGGKVERAADWGLGIYPVHLYRQLPGLPGSRPVAIYAMHQDQVVEPAADFELLGGSRFCPYYLMWQNDRVLTIQGHPEFTRDFFYRFLEVAEHRFDSKAVTQAHQIIWETDDSEPVCRLLNHFLLGTHTTERDRCEKSG